MSTASAAPSAITVPWLRPASASLLVLTDDAPDSSVLRLDPGLILHVLRYSRPTPGPTTFVLNEATLCQPGLCETAAKLLEYPNATGHPSGDSARIGQQLAQIAAKLARETKLCSPDAAWCAGLLAPLGWYLGAPDHAVSIGRKHLARWRMPLWFQIAVGYLDLPIDETQTLGGHLGINRVLRAAIRASESTYFPKVNRESDAELDSLATSTANDTPEYREVRYDVEPMLLPRLLKATAQARGRTAQTWMAPLEDRIDALVEQLAEARLDFDNRLRDAKLDALAEFAAGASHEFNNPLAVISGNAQWLRGREADPDKAQHLQTIVRQTQRIHDLLTGTRQFSCPSQAKTSPHSVETLLARVQHDFQADAEAQDIQLFVLTDADSSIQVDAAQVQTALGHLVRNALEAAGKGGWVKLSATTDLDRVTIHVDDSGTGPDEHVQDHLFDPFFSGRSAGRGRGLGLSIAWALAKNNNGEVRWAGRDGPSTRFTLMLPQAVIHHQVVPARQVA